MSANIPKSQLPTLIGASRLNETDGGRKISRAEAAQIKKTAVGEANGINRLFTPAASITAKDRGAALEDIRGSLNTLGRDEFEDRNDYEAIGNFAFGLR